MNSKYKLEKKKIRKGSIGSELSKEKTDLIVTRKYPNFKMRSKNTITMGYTLHRKLTNKFECQTV